MTRAVRAIPDWQHPAALVPAAGGAVRFGQAKLLLPLLRRPLVRRVAAVLLAAGCRPVIVVVRPHDRGVRAALRGLPAVVVTNPTPDLGMGSSLACAARACPPSIAGAVVALADQPLISVALVRGLVSVWHGAPRRIVRPVCGGTVGHPVLFDRTYLPALCRLDGDEGARRLVERGRDRLALLEVADRTVFADIDAPGDYDALHLRLAARRTKARTTAPSSIC